MDTITLIVAILGWTFAALQFFLSHMENKKKNKSELLEKTLQYFERGTQARSIGISLIEGIWIKDKKKLKVIAPVITSQITFLLTDAENFAQEEQNLYRLLYLALDCIPYAHDPTAEYIEIGAAIAQVAGKKHGIIMSESQINYWIEKFDKSELKEGK